MAVLLDPNSAWKEDPGNPLRSRYTGYPLKDGEMVITILSQGSFSFGHQVIIFEWRHNEANVPYRKHKAFHLYPTDEHAIQGDSYERVGACASLSTGSFPGKIVRERPTIINDGVPVSAVHGKEASDIEAASLTLINKRVNSRGEIVAVSDKPARAKSWAVPWADGNEAFQQARADWKAPPKFNLLGKAGGKSCASWVAGIAQIAGIDTGSILGSTFGFYIPANEVSDGFDVLSEDEMWRNREG